MISRWYYILMKKINEQTYSIKEIQKSLDQYLDSSADRLRLRLKNAWKKQVTIRPSTHAEVKI